VPLVGAKIEIEHDLMPRSARLFDGEECGAATWFLAQRRGRHFQDARSGNRRRQHVVNGQGNVRAVVAVKDERKLVRWFDAEDHGTGAPAGFSRDERRLDALFLQEMEDEITHRIFAYCGQEGCFQTQPARAHGNVGRGAADVGGETLNFHEGRPYVVGVKVDRGTPYGDQIVIGVLHLLFQSRLITSDC
jgi:hypothetical protein